MLSFETSETGGVTVVTFEDTGEAADNRTTANRQALYQTIESQSDPRFAFDLGAIHYLASSDIGFLLTLKRRVTARKGRVILFSVDPYLLDVLHTMKLHSLFEYAANLREALAALAAPPAR